LSLGLCVGVGIAFIGNVPNSILLGRWFGARLPTAMAIVAPRMADTCRAGFVASIESSSVSGLGVHA